ncbi:MAG: primase C-terminal domain-containing protein [Deltaproteobacteria bacterium]|nr:primase C-terminal domain-containing protein [Deltaproteobacteria bacterium]
MPTARSYDLRTAAHSQVVVEPSIHETGAEYRWARRLPEDLSTLPVCPQEIVDGYNQMVAERQRQESAARRDGVGLGPKFPNTTRNNEMIKLAYQIRERSLTEEEFEAEVYEANEKRCDPPMDRSEVADIIKSARRKTELLAFTFDTPPSADSPVGQGTLRPGVVPFRPARSLDDTEGLAVDCWVKGSSRRTRPVSSTAPIRLGRPSGPCG